MLQKLSNNLVGTSGEYYVCAELCRRGFLALLTPKNNPLFDIIATNSDGSKTVSIQVKTRSPQNKQGWKLGTDITKNKYNRNLFVVLVNLEDEGQLPDFYIYEYDILAEIVNRQYVDYLSKRKRDGSERKDVGFRWHDTKNFNEDDEKRRDNWTPIITMLTNPAVFCV